MDIIIESYVEISVRCGRSVTMLICKKSNCVMVERKDKAFVDS